MKFRSFTENVVSVCNRTLVTHAFLIALVVTGGQHWQKMKTSWSPILELNYFIPQSHVNEVCSYRIIYFKWKQEIKHTLETWISPLLLTPLHSFIYTTHAHSVHTRTLCSPNLNGWTEVSTLFRLFWLCFLLPIFCPVALMIFLPPAWITLRLSNSTFTLYWLHFIRISIADSARF